MIDNHPFPEDFLQPPCQLSGESNFRHKKQRLIAALQHIVDQMNIDFGLAARRHAVEQGDIVVGQSAVDFVESFSLSF